MTPWIWVVASYLLGSTPSSYLAGRWARGIDLREHGSGNLGATNSFRVLGARIAAPVMIFDMVKGFIPTALFGLWDSSDVWAWSLAYGAAAILGHVFSIYMRFRGGKGVATAAGVFLALSPVAVGVALAAWLIVLKVGRMVSLASIVAAAILVGTLILTESRSEVLTLGILVATFVIYGHRTNVRRILAGEEHRFGQPRAPQGGPVVESANGSSIEEGGT
ncbi:MAG: glycerol-3-phosphate 1-O-acyltransferase PlsY [Gemmatimonadota bacterium]